MPESSTTNARLQEQMHSCPSASIMLRHDQLQEPIRVSVADHLLQVSDSVVSRSNQLKSLIRTDSKRVWLFILTNIKRILMCLW